MRISADITSAIRLPAATVLGLAIFSLALCPDADAQQTSPGTSSMLLSATTGSGARALGMGGAFTAIADDGTAGSWNPAGLALLDRPETSFVGNFSRTVTSTPSYELTRNYGSGLRVVESGPAISTRRTSQHPDFAHITYPLRLGKWKLVPQFSYRRLVNTNFSQSTDQPYQYSESTGFKETGSDNLRFESDRGIDVYSGSVGASVHPRLTVGAAVNVWRGRTNGNDARTIRATYSLGSASGPLNPGSYRTTYEETLEGSNVDLGVLFTPLHRVHVGAVVRNKFVAARQHSYDRRYSNWSGDITRETYSESGKIDWPLSVSVGAAVKPADALTLSTDYTRSEWSKATYRFTSSDDQTINGKITTLHAAGTVIYPDMYDASSPVRPYFNVPQHDSAQLRFGGEFTWRRSDRGPLRGIPLRAGAYRYRLLVPQSNGDEQTGHGFTAGAGVIWRELRLDVAYLRESVRGKTAEFPVTTFSGLSVSQRQGGTERTVLGRLLFSIAVRL